MRIGRVISNRIQKGLRWIKFNGLGTGDTLDKRQYLPAGIDSAPQEGQEVLYCETGINGKGVVLGYLLKKMAVEAGEIKVFSYNADGDQLVYILCTKDGEIHMDGSEDNLVRFSKLKAGFDQLRSDHNDLVAKHNQLLAKHNQLSSSHVSHQHTSTAPGSPTTPGVPPATGAPSTDTANISSASIDDSKINNIKTS